MIEYLTDGESARAMGDGEFFPTSNDIVQHSLLSVYLVELTACFRRIWQLILDQCVANHGRPALERAPRLQTAGRLACHAEPTKNCQGSGQKVASVLPDPGKQLRALESRAMLRTPQATNEGEEVKRITAILLEGTGLVLIDNINRPLGSGALDAFLTGTLGVWKVVAGILARIRGDTQLESGYLNQQPGDECCRPRSSFSSR